LPNPYSVFEDNDGYYFITDHNVKYKIIFDSLGDLFKEYPLLHGRIFSFSFHPVHSEIIPRRFDPRVKDTLSFILFRFFENKKNLIVFVCDSMDGKALCRKRLFESWFAKMNDGSLEKYDGCIAEGRKEEIQNSVLVRADMADKDYVIRVFEDLNDVFSSSK
jgi:hypothetical protein